MAQAPRAEPHFTASDIVSDIILGLADGLTVPFALAAGLSGAATATHIVIIAGVAEIAAGSISMGLGGSYQRATISSTTTSSASARNGKRARCPSRRRTRCGRSCA